MWECFIGFRFCCVIGYWLFSVFFLFYISGKILGGFWYINWINVMVIRNDGREYGMNWVMLID